MLRERWAAVFQAPVPPAAGSSGGAAGSSLPVPVPAGAPSVAPTASPARRGAASSPPNSTTVLVQRLRMSANALLVRATEVSRPLNALDDGDAALALLMAIEAVLEHGYSSRVGHFLRSAHFWQLLEQLELFGGTSSAGVAAARAAGVGGGDRERAHAWLCWELNRAQLHADLGLVLEERALREAHYAEAALLCDELQRSTFLCLLEPLSQIRFELPLALSQWPQPAADGAATPPAPPVPAPSAASGRVAQPAAGDGGAGAEDGAKRADAGLGVASAGAQLLEPHAAPAGAAARNLGGASPAAARAPAAAATHAPQARGVGGARAQAAEPGKGSGRRRRAKPAARPSIGDEGLEDTRALVREAAGGGQAQKGGSGGGRAPRTPPGGARAAAVTPKAAHTSAEEEARAPLEGRAARAHAVHMVSALEQLDAIDDAPGSAFRQLEALHGSHADGGHADGLADPTLPPAAGADHWPRYDDMANADGRAAAEYRGGDTAEGGALTPPAGGKATQPGAARAALRGSGNGSEPAAGAALAGGGAAAGGTPPRARGEEDGSRAPPGDATAVAGNALPDRAAPPAAADARAHPHARASPLQDEAAEAAEVPDSAEEGSAEEGSWRQSEGRRMSWGSSAGILLPSPAEPAPSRPAPSSAAARGSPGAAPAVPSPAARVRVRVLHSDCAAHASAQASGAAAAAGGGGVASPLSPAGMSPSGVCSGILATPPSAPDSSRSREASPVVSVTYVPAACSGSGTPSAQAARPQARDASSPTAGAAGAGVDAHADADAGVLSPLGGGGAQLVETSPMSAIDSPGGGCAAEGSTSSTRSGGAPPVDASGLGLHRVAAVQITGVEMRDGDADGGGGGGGSPALVTLYRAEARIGPFRCVVHRRYSHFVALQFELEKALPRAQFPRVVAELKKGRYRQWTWGAPQPLDGPAVEGRLRLLQAYCDELLGLAGVAACEQFARFFWPRGAEGDYVERWDEQTQ